MTTVVDPHAPVSALPSDGPAAPTELRPAYCLLAVPVAAGLAVGGFAVAVVGDPQPVELARPFVVALWAVAGLVLGVRRRHDRLAPIVLGGAIVGGAGTLAAAVVEHRALTGAASFGWDLTLRLTATMLPAIAMHVLFGLADGRLVTSVRRRAVIAGYVLAGVVGVALMTTRSSVTVWPVVALWVTATALGLHASHVRYVTAGAVDRRRMQWVGWGMAVATEAALVAVALRLLTDWPHHVGAVVLGLSGLIPLALALGALPGMVARVDRLLTRTVEVAGLTAVVVAIYLVVVVGLGRTPDPDERALLFLSMAAAGLSAVTYLPARRWLTERANRLVYGERVAPDELLRTFGQRLTRSIPMDELLLQLTESLRKAMLLTSAEVWTGQDGHYELAAGVPHRRATRIEIGATESSVVARAGVSGGTWLDIWIPAVVGANGSAAMRLAPVAHAGELLGFIAVTRRRDGEPFTESEDRVLTELARQVALALHNVQLDTALQASLDELRVRNDELQQSRTRIVAAGDAERRKLERNLHDGAQQHLVALAVKLRLTRDAVEDDPADAIAMIDEIKGNVQDAIQELRALAHGIFPPLLMSGGLPEALPAAATRAPLPTIIDTGGVGRYSPDMEAAVYFCILEALQNAGKHAGEEATARVTVSADVGTLRFEVADDGAGFDAAGAAGSGHGFVNMADRLGAFGGAIDVRSALGVGTTVVGTLPLATTP